MTRTTLDRIIADLQAKQGKLEEQLAQAEAHGNTILAEALKSEIQALQCVIASECANAVR